MSEDIQIEVPQKPGVFRFVLPWAVVAAALGLMGWQRVETTSDNRQTVSDNQDLERRQQRAERRLDSAEATAKAQFDEIIRRLDRIEDRLDKK